MVTMTTSGSPARERARWVAFATVLLAVAVISALLWWLLRTQQSPELAGGVQPLDETTTPGRSTVAPTEPTPAAPEEIEAGELTFTRAAPPDATDDCAKVSYGDVAGFFRDNPCERVVRGLYTTTNADSQALVSIVVVTMPSEAGANQLKGLTDTSGTGNVSDMIRDGSAAVDGAPSVAGGSYASTVSGAKLTIVEGAYFDSRRGDASLLNLITTEAVQVGAHLDG